MTNTGNRKGLSNCLCINYKVLFSSGLQLIFTNDLIYVSKLPSRRKQLKDYTSGI